jgi:hypothetical protein
MTFGTARVEAISERLREQFGINWALVSDPAPAGLDCRWYNGVLSVCRIAERYK